jgi:hypothetical protein
VNFDDGISLTTPVLPRKSSISWLAAFPLRANETRDTTGRSPEDRDPGRPENRRDIFPHTSLFWSVSMFTNREKFNEIGEKTPCHISRSLGVEIRM